MVSITAYAGVKRKRNMTKIKIVGVGGTGNDILGILAREKRLGNKWIDVDLVAINTDVAHLRNFYYLEGKEPDVTTRVRIGKTLTKGLGAGGHPDIGKQAAENESAEIKKALEDGQIILLCANMGGGTGGGASPVVSEIARNTGARVIALAVMPSRSSLNKSEKKWRTEVSEQSLAKLKEKCDAVLVFDLDKFAPNKVGYSKITNLIVAQAANELTIILDKQSKRRIPPYIESEIMNEGILKNLELVKPWSQ